VTPAAVIDALGLPAASLVGQRVPKKLLLENGAPTAADKRLINEGIEDIQWLAALKPAVVGAPEFRDATREYLEIAVLQLTLRAAAKAERLIELVHRAVPYPVLLVIAGESVGLSSAHKRQSFNEAGKVVLDGEAITVELSGAPDTIQQALVEALPVFRQPRASLFALYQGWMDALTAFQAALIPGTFRLLDSAELASARRQALQASLRLQDQIADLRAAAVKASQMARQVELNLEIKRLQAALSAAQAQL
jgi:hypothetical protein